METPYRADNLTGMPLEHYMGRLKTADASEISARLGLEWDGRGFTLNVLGEDRHINFPAFDDEGWTDRWRILFGRYLLEGKKASPMHGFLTYPEMPWGETYNEKFRQRCILRLAGTYGFRPAAWEPRIFLPAATAGSLSSCPGCSCASLSGRVTRSSRPRRRSSFPTISPTLSRRKTASSYASISSAK